MDRFMISEQGIALIKRFEGFSATPYICPGGYKTIGYGHMVKKEENFPEKGITELLAETILRDDISVFEHTINQQVTVELGQNQIDALLSLVYNIGSHAFEKSTLLRVLNTRDYHGAAREFQRWVYVKGRKSNGLIRRRTAESALFSKNMPYLTKL